VPIPAKLSDWVSEEQAVAPVNVTGKPEQIVVAETVKFEEPGSFVTCEWECCHPIIVNSIKKIIFFIFFLKFCQKY
jgi:hypothetical protein